MNILQKLVSFENLTVDEAKSFMEKMFREDSDKVYAAGVLTALRMKGETREELTGFSEAMFEACQSIKPKAEKVLDIVGTGGDGLGTFNVSTTAMFIAAACGITVAKHGNRAVSSSSGSADVLRELGVHPELTPDQVKACLDEIGLAFLLAPVFHPNMRFAAPVRQSLKMRTVFNFLGPLTNPAQANCMLLGVCDESIMLNYAEILAERGTSGYVVRGMDGADEISVCDLTEAYRIFDGRYEKVTINPKNHGMDLYNHEDVRGGLPPENAVILRSILEGKLQGPKRDMALLNAAYAVAATLDISLDDSLEKCKKTLEDGTAADKLNSLIEYTSRNK